MSEPIYVDQEMMGIFYFLNSVVRHPDQLNQNSAGWDQPQYNLKPDKWSQWRVSSVMWRIDGGSHIIYFPVQQ